jgi:hypothetical protein
MKNERDSLARLKSSKPPTVLGIRIMPTRPFCVRSAELRERMPLTDMIRNDRLVNG